MGLIMADDAYDARYLEGAPEGAGGLDLRGVLAMFQRRIRWFAAVAIVLMVAVIAVGLVVPPHYTATANIVIDQHQKKLLDTDTQSNAAPDTNVVDTDVQMIMSYGLADRVTRLLHLDQDPHYNPAMGPGGKDAVKGLTPDQVYEETVANVQRHLKVKRSGLTYVIEVAFTSKDANAAAQIANAFADQFVVAEVETESGVDTSTDKGLNQQLASLQASAESADQAVQQYKIAHNLFSAEGSTIAEQEVSTLSQQIAEAQADLADKSAQLQAAQTQLQRGGEGSDVGAAVNSETIRELRAQEATASQNVAQLSANYGPRYPDLIKAKDQLKDIRSQIQQEINRILSSLQAQVAAATQRLASLKASQGGARGSLIQNNAAQSGLLELQRRADAAEAVYQTFLNTSKTTAATASVQQPDARVDVHAQPPINPSFPNMTLFAAAAIIIGLGGGLSVVLLLEYLDVGIRTGADVERRFGLPYWGALPDLKSIVEARKRAASKSPHDYLLSHPLSVFAEAFRNLRAFLVLKTTDHTHPQVIAVSSALPKEGKSTTSFCLMRTIAQSGAKVVLVDCDLRRRAVTGLMDKPEAGIVELLEGKATLNQVIIKDDKTEGWVIPATPATGGGDTLFSGEAMDKLIEHLRANFDFVIIDTPPVLAVADSRILAARADLTLFLIRWGQTPPSAARAALDILRDTGAKVGGVALSLVDLRRQSKYSVGDGSYYYKAYNAYYVNN